MSEGGKEGARGGGSEGVREEFLCVLYMCVILSV